MKKLLLPVLRSKQLQSSYTERELEGEKKGISQGQAHAVKNLTGAVE